jgi:hypothetical protein
MENWMKSKGNPYVVGVKRSCPCKRNKAHFGKPIQLFKDSDKDGVANVFDCKPYNKRKQDVLAPMTGGNPMQEMYARREQSRQLGDYMKQVKAWEQQAKQDQQATEDAQSKAIDEWNRDWRSESQTDRAREAYGRQGKYMNEFGEIVPIKGWTPKTSGGMISRSSGSVFSATTKLPPKEKVGGVWVGGKFYPQKTIAQRAEQKTTTSSGSSSSSRSSGSSSSRSSGFIGPTTTFKGVDGKTVTFGRVK